MIDTKLIDHTNLKAYATKEDILKLCNEAYKYNFKSVCVNPSRVSLCKELLHGTDILVCSVIGFPLGATTSDVKAYETTTAIANGCDEVDMVINVGLAKDHDYEGVYEDILAVVKAASGTLVKVILETCYLNEEEIIECCKQAQRAGADFVKTSTGFGSRGASVEDVLTMKNVVGDTLGVKASGGIHNISDFNKMVNAGATRIGTSNGVDIVLGDKNE